MPTNCELSLPVTLPGDTWEKLAYCGARTGQKANEVLASLAQRWLKPTGLADISEICQEIVRVSRNWNEFIEQLAYHDLKCVPAGSGLAVTRISTNMRFCTGSEVGLCHKSLMKRFRAPIPGEHRPWMIEMCRQMLAASSKQHLLC